jgi:hypothetical protein
MSRGRRSIFIGNEWHIHIHGTGGKTESSGREGEVHVQREEATSTSLKDGGGAITSSAGSTDRFAVRGVMGVVKGRTAPKG